MESCHVEWVVNPNTGRVKLKARGGLNSQQGKAGVDELIISIHNF